MKPGLVRIRLLDGSWTLEANAEGTKTWATYWLYTDPGGYVPAFIANTANVDGVPQLFEAVRGRLVKPRQGG